MPQNVEQAPKINDKEILSEQSETASHQHSQAVGAKLLTVANFDTRNKAIVDSSFNKARTRSERLPGKNSERRNYAYIDRLEKLIDKRGNNLEKRLWKKSSEKLIISPEDIPESYWKTQEQILRDNGHGHELSQYEKDHLTQDIQKQQKESLEQWTNYLGDEQSPYPMWFKLYAWDGMSKMGAFDINKKEFSKRNKGTVAPYPKLNPAALAKLYGAISQVYKISDNARYDENAERNEILDNLVKSGNFNKLYSKLLLDTKTIIKTPERTEDVHGEWKEYLPGEEEALAVAAEGTPWCIADPGTGKNYLENGGTYAGSKETEYGENQAKFILFHLTDPNTGVLADNACASIRLSTDGNVAEISGLNEGQALEDSLVPIVEEKVKTLPGGERFLEAFTDKKRLIELDHKMQRGEAFDEDDLDFIFENKRSIKKLDTYNNIDPRLKELKNAETLLKNGTDLGMFLDRADNLAIVDSANILRQYNNRSGHPSVDISAVANHLSNDEIEQIAESTQQIDNTDLNNVINNAGMSLTVDEVLPRLHSLTTNHVKFDKHAVELAAQQMNEYDIQDYFNGLVVSGVMNLNELIERANAHTISTNFDTIQKLTNNIDAQLITDKLESSDSLYDIANHIGWLKEHGANIDTQKLVNDLQHENRSEDILRNLAQLRRYGAEIDIDKLADSRGVSLCLYELCGSDRGYFRKMNPENIKENLQTFLTSIKPEIALEHLDEVQALIDKFKKWDVNIDINVSALEKQLTDSIAS